MMQVDGGTCTKRHTDDHSRDTETGTDTGTDTDIDTDTGIDRDRGGHIDVSHIVVSVVSEVRLCSHLTFPLHCQSPCS